MDTLILFFDLAGTAVALGIAAWTLLRRARRAALSREAAIRDMLRRLAALEDSHARQGADMSRLALSTLALKQEIIRLDAKLNGKDSQTPETTRRPPHMLH